MKIIESIREMQDIAKKAKREQIRIGFVPTMGFLHEGHLSLVRVARKENAQVAASIFINPTQFGPHEDFNAYPRDLERDITLLEREQVDIVFIPKIDQIYSENHRTFVFVEKIAENLCGYFRPGHFQGVVTIVCKLFHIIQPDTAYFGQKDYQQLMVIKKMVADLNMDIEIKGLPIVREKDGLAMSSRNTYLTEEQREQALCLYRLINQAKKMREEGVDRALEIITALKKNIEMETMVRPEYIRICHPETLKNLQVIKDRALLAMAIHVGKTRLIDNCLL